MKQTKAVESGINVAEHLADNIFSVTYENLQPEVIEAAKREILDTLGLILVGSVAQGCPELVTFAEEEGGKPESTILPYGRRITATNAAMVNSTMAHAWDFDDTDDRTGNHVGSIAVPSALAVAEHTGGVSGKDLITAVTLGADLGCRLLLSTRHSLAGPTTATSAPFVSAATAAKILGLKSTEIAHALGLAFAQVAFGSSHFTGASLTKRLKAGLGSRAGVLAALLAQKGLKATLEDTFQGARGFYHTFYREEGNLENLCSGSGKRFESVNLSIKPYPCCRGNHGAIDATLSLIKEHRIKQQEIREVLVHLGERSCHHLGGIDSAVQAIKRRPRFAVEAQFSIYWTVAAALAKGRVMVDSFTEKGLKDEEIHAMSQKIKVVANRELSNLPITLTPAIIEIKTEKGNTHSCRVELARGNPALGWSWKETEDKFWECTHYSIIPLSRDSLQKAVKLISHLEQVKDVSVLAKLLSTAA